MQNGDSGSGNRAKAERVAALTITVGTSTRTVYNSVWQTKSAELFADRSHKRACLVSVPGVGVGGVGGVGGVSSWRWFVAKVVQARG